MIAQASRPIGTIAFASAFLTSASAILPANMAFAVDCLDAPNSAAPPRSHWYYRTDRTQLRKCWHLQADNAPALHDTVQIAGQTPPGKPSQSVSTSGQYSLASFRAFMAQNGAAKLSDQDVERLYAAFLEWKRHAND